jgi:hypothetical protein
MLRVAVAGAGTAGPEAGHRYTGTMPSIYDTLNEAPAPAHAPADEESISPTMGA